MNSFPERLKQLREEMELTQKILGSMLNVSDATINRYEKGLRNPDPNTLAKLAEIFNVSTDYLLGRTNTRTPTTQSEESVYAAHRDDGYDQPLDPETLAYINRAVEEAFRKREEWLKKSGKQGK